MPAAHSKASRYRASVLMVGRHKSPTTATADHEHVHDHVNVHVDVHVLVDVVVNRLLPTPRALVDAGLLRSRDGLDSPSALVPERFAKVSDYPRHRPNFFTACHSGATHCHSASRRTSSTQSSTFMRH